VKSGWALTSIGNVCTVIAGQSPEGQFYNDQSIGLPFFQGKKDFQEKHIGEARVWTSKSTKEAQAGDILMSVRAPVGPINFATQHCCIGRGLAAIRAGKECDVDYLYYVLLSKESEISGNEGAVFASINKSEIQKIEIPLPPLEEQLQIVAVLDKAFAGIATATANAQKNLTNARALFESYTSEAFEQINETAITRPSLEALTDDKSGITYGVVKPGDIGSIPFVRGGDLIGGEVRLHKLRTITSAVSEQYSRTLLRGGELLMCLVGVPGQCAIAPNELAGANIARQVGLIRLKPEVNAEYVKDYLQSPVGQTALGTFTGGSVQQVINLGDLRQVEVPLPERSKQDEMVKRIAVAKSLSSDLARKFDKKLTALSELKQSLLQKAFAGELT
jgi:type I restriction enzyme S subunit